eukprot:CCRYP_009212-RA/>CCRYP_009212-RA protein AED:0.44 eAED:0.14 QI:0/-1/0/1/-1/1/1/0/824
MFLFPWRILPLAVPMSLPDPERSMILVFPLLALMFLASRPWHQYFSYGYSLPARMALFLCDLRLGDPEFHLWLALADLHHAHCQFDDYPYFPAIPGLTSMPPWPFPDLASAHQDSLLPYPPVQALFHSFGRKPSWRFRRFCRNAHSRYKQLLRQMTLGGNTPRDIVAPSDPPSPPAASSAVQISHFLSSFNPAKAGRWQLVLARHDRHCFRQVKSQRTVSVHLRHCRESLLSHTISEFCLPAIMESVFNTIAPDGSPLIVDSGVSCCISPHWDDFIEYHPSTVRIKDLSGLNSVAGQGMVQWLVRDINGHECKLLLPGYHVPQVSVRLLSPQSLFRAVGGEGHQTVDKFRLSLANGITLDAPYGRANLPTLPLATSQDKCCLWQQCFAFSSSDSTAWTPSVIAASNQNLSLAQKEILLWHQRLSHASLSTIHNLCRQSCRLVPRSPDNLVPLHWGHFLPCTYNVPNAVCDHLLCGACECAKAKRRRPRVVGASAGATRSMVLKQNHLHPGDCLSCDHYISPIPGRVVAPSGYSSTRHGYVGGTIYVDHASGWIFHSPQKSLNAADTIRGKLLLEREAAELDIQIKALHSDNGVFNSAEFRQHCDSYRQRLSFSGVGAHHQNGVAERSIQAIANMARASMRHASLRWPDRPILDLWPLAMSYAIWVDNQLPPSGAGLSPDERWSQVKLPSSRLSQAHAFGCPVYVLNPALQDGKQIPKWNSRARQGIFVGFSSNHSSLVPLIYNPRSQHISPQYHVIFDDAFLTVPALNTPTEMDDQFACLFETSRESFVDPHDVEARQPPWMMKGSLLTNWTPSRPRGRLVFAN